MKEIKIALAGNPNCGKTTLFNSLTGSNQYVGNWPGVTVEKKEGKFKEDKNVIIQDLPGIYSLSPYTPEEIVTRNYLVEDKPDAILNIVDGTNIERNLYLTTQLLETGIPLVMAVNMIDVVNKNGDKINFAELSKALGCKVIPISALKGNSTVDAARLSVLAASEKNQVEQPHVFKGSVEHALAHIEESIQGKVDKNQIRWFAVKVFERDEKVLEKLNLSAEEKSHIEEHIKDCEKELDDDSESIITNQRYEYIQKLVAKTVVKKNKEKLTLSDKIDRVVTNRILGLPIFLAVMWLVYWCSTGAGFGTMGTDWVNDVLFGEWILGGTQTALENAGANPVLIDCLVNGVLGGLGAVLGFLPQMAVLFLLLSILEDCGYMVRIAFVMDRIFRRFGLSGKSFIPLLISSGCGIPGIMASRTIENENDRRMTIMTTTWIPCGAKLPVIALMAAVIGSRLTNTSASWLAPVMYITGVAAVLLAAVMLKKTKAFHGPAAPFVMELPQYHFPEPKTVLLHTWERLRGFLVKAGTILFVACLVMWFLSSYGISDGHFGLVEAGDSILAKIGGVLRYIFIPLGFGGAEGGWQAAAASLSGFSAKEAIVTTMGVLANVSEELVEDGDAVGLAVSEWFPTAIAAFSFLLFNLLDSPCLAAIATMKSELNSRKWFWFAILFQNIFAYVVTLIVYQLGMLFVHGAFGVGTVFAFIFLAVILYAVFRKNPYKEMNV
ncbi:ferrous iron transport protein B [uncultured Treponema sp.]|uniref:ferrous iron transport protein B n=1 Tax=uncultured Treponema sp. TaxID=162155 RepID=UPI00258B6F3E|nr:ferrous iron transport protein B [uncultured Treponema sp.]